MSTAAIPGQFAALLPAPARYFPITRERYEVGPGLSLLGRDFGEGERDALAFQLDSEFPRCRAEKLAARRQDLAAYYLTAGFSPEVAQAVTTLFVERLTTEHPQYFRLDEQGGGQSLACALTGETLALTDDLRIAATDGPQPPYADALDALCSQVQEDVAIVALDAQDDDRVVAVHVCCPSGWAPAEKVGLAFPAVHAPVPGIEPVTRVSASLMSASVAKGPYVRFGWGIAGDARLNRHPQPPPGTDPVLWNAPAFNRSPGSASPFYLRVERQVLWGLPEVRAFVFLIRVYLVPGADIRANQEERRQLAGALRSLSLASADYKGLTASLPALLAYLEGDR